MRLQELGALTLQHHLGCLRLLPFLSAANDELLDCEQLRFAEQSVGLRLLQFSLGPQTVAHVC